MTGDTLAMISGVTGTRVCSVWNVVTHSFTYREERRGRKYFSHILLLFYVSIMLGSVSLVNMEETDFQKSCLNSQTETMLRPESKLKSVNWSWLILTRIVFLLAITFHLLFVLPPIHRNNPKTWEELFFDHFSLYCRLLVTEIARKSKEMVWLSGQCN